MGFNKASTSTMVLAVMLLTSMPLLGVVQCSSNFSASVGSNLSSTQANIIINEFMADNSITIAGPDGNSPDWIELFNPGTETVDLTGMYLTDDLTDPTCWQFPDDTTIKPGEYMIVWAVTNGGEGYASFSLNANGEEIGLFANDGVTLIDSVSYTKQLQDVSYGRDPNDNTIWDYLPTATPGSANRDSVGGETSVWSLVVIVVLFIVVAALVVFIGKLNEKRR